MKKRVVFHFYIGDRNWRGNKAVLINLRALSYFSHVFDEAVVVISTDITDKDIIKEIKTTVISMLDVPSVTVKLCANTVYREARTFFDEVVDSSFEGITFFCHTKGYTNIGNPDMTDSCVIDWILGGYYLSLAFMKETEICLSRSSSYHSSSFFGSFSVCDSDGTSFLPSIYSGTFFWVNMPSLRSDFKIAGKKLPVLSDRYSAERFPGLCYAELPFYPGSHRGAMIYQEKTDFYGKHGEPTPKYSTGEGIEFILGDNGDDVEKYEKFKEFVLKDIE